MILAVGLIVFNLICLFPYNINTTCIIAFIFSICFPTNVMILDRIVFKHIPFITVIRLILP